MTEKINDYQRLRRAAIGKDFSRMNPMQMQAVVKINGPVLILAGAGSGKTTVLVNRIANMVKYGDAFEARPDGEPSEQELDAARAYTDNPAGAPPPGFAVNPVLPWQILAITFTNKAAGELKERIEAKLGRTAGEVHAGTFHSTCARILRRYADRIGYTSHFTIYDTDDQKRMMKEVYKQLNLNDKTLPVRTILSGISKAKDSLIPPAAFSDGTNDFLKKQIGSAYALYQKLMVEAGAMDFDDLLVNTVRLFEENPDILAYYQDRFRYIMVDEYQDTNHAQYIFIKLLAAKHRNICVVGDDDQSIYRFRGATIKNILNFEKEYKEAVVIRLEQNYRSTKIILGAANAVIRANTERKGKNLWTENEEGPKITDYTAPDEQAEARYIADTILDNVQAGEKFSSHAVLYRTNAQSNTLENVFVRSGVPYKMIGGLRFYDRKEIRDVIAYLQVINNPADAIRLRRIINEPKRAIGEATVNAAAQIADGLGTSIFAVAENAMDYPALSRAASKLVTFTDMIHELRAAAQEVSLHELLELTLHKTGYMQALEASGEDAADRIENVNELSSNILKYEEEHDDASLEGFLEETALINDIDALDGESDRAVMMTLHTAKGLEFDHVFISGMEEGLFPGNQSIYGGPQEIEEERRLAYVGITRAKKSLALTHANTRMLYGTTSRNRPSRFLNEIPEEYLAISGSTLSAREFHVSRPEAGASYYKQSERGASSFTDFGSSGHTAPSGHLRPAARAAASGNLAPKTAAASYAVGTRIRHKAFGEGTIVKCTPMGNDTLLEIQFERAGTKKLMSNFAKLDVL